MHGAIESLRKNGRDRANRMKTIAKIISGGQTGADRAGLDAALARNLPHGGWCPRGRLAEDGRIASRYQLRQTESPAYAVRTERNVLDSDVTLVFTFGPPQGGSAATVGFAARHHRPWLHLDLTGRPDRGIVEKIRAWLQSQPLQQELWSMDSERQTEPGERGLVINIAHVFDHRI